MRIFLIGVFLMAGCAQFYTVRDPVTNAEMARCYQGGFNAFCVVQTPPGTTAVAGAPVVLSVGTLLYGVGNMAIGAGTLK